MGDDRDSGSGASGIILSFLLGGLAGAAVAVLYAPRSGRETREILGERLREGKERGKRLREKAVARGRGLLEDATDYVERQKESLDKQRERLSAAVDAGRQAYREEKEKS
jgi:gas vesicle protein